MTRNLPAADWTSKFVEANGIRHHYLEWGDASNPALLMLHATGLCAWSWKPVARELAQDYRVLAFDQRGHGDTDRSDRGYGFEFVGDDLAAIVEKLDLERPRVIGHLSGRLAAILAANLIPDRLGPVVLVETRVSNDAATVPTQDLNLCAERTRMKRAVWESREAMFAAYRTRAAFKDWESEALEQFTSCGTTLLADGRAELKCHPETEATFYSIRDSLSVQDYFAGLNGDGYCSWQIIRVANAWKTPECSNSDGWLPAPRWRRWARAATSCRWNFQATHWPQSEPGLTRFHNVPKIGVDKVHQKLRPTEPAPGHCLYEFGLIY